MAASGQPGDEKPEYQHFIPQFMLKNFAHKYTDPNGGKRNNKKRKPNKQNAKDENKLYPGEPVVNNVDLKADPFVITEAKVKRVFGQYDLYEDPNQAGPHRREIESLLGKLEGQVGIIFRKITKAFENSEPGLCLDRREMFTLRKFMFIQKYRGAGFHRRFNHDSPDGYKEDDALLVRDYMNRTGLKRPIDVWFQGLKVIISLDFTKKDWEEQILKSMFPGDAQWFIIHFKIMYMAICTPSSSVDEFILTANAHNVFEGPSDFVKDAATGETKPGPWLNFHEFCPVSPKLMIVLRSWLLPVPEEDADPSMARLREEMMKECLKGVSGSPKSLLADLPITKARNDYTEIVDGRVQLLPGKFGSLSDKFRLRFHPIETEHVNVINHFMFDNAFRGAGIVFGTQTAFFRTLDWYMTITPGKYGKIISGDRLEEKRRFMVNLAALAKSLGSTKEPVWRDVEKIREMLTSIGPYLFAASPDSVSSTAPGLSEPRQLLSCHGCAVGSLLEDIVGAFSMRRLQTRVKAADAQAYNFLTNIYMKMPTRRVFLYIKMCHREALGLLDDDTADPGVETEEVIGQALHCIIPSEKLNRLMYITMVHDIARFRDHTLSYNTLWLLPHMTEQGAARLRQFKKTVFVLPGSLDHCGIPEVEALAQSAILELRGIDLSRFYPNKGLERKDKIELLTRVLVKKKFKKALAGKVEAGILDQLHDVFFDLTYPTPPMEISGLT